MSSRIARIVLFPVFVGLSATQGFADCKPDVDKFIAQRDITDLIFIRKDTFGTAAPNETYWFTHPSCATTGYVVIETNNTCYVQQAYTKFGCHIPGLKHYNF